MRMRLLAFAIILTATALFAQTFRGTILGTVTDVTGAWVTGAKVTVHNDNTGLERTTQTGADGSYTVTPGEQLFFRAGHASNPGPVVGNCGCPAPIVVESAAAEPVRSVPAPTAPPAPPAPALIESPRNANVTAPPPAIPPEGVHVQVEAPFVFRASEPPPAPDVPVELAQVRLSTLPVLSPALPQPPSQEVAQAAIPDTAKPRKKKHHGLWGFLASMFKG